MADRPPDEVFAQHLLKAGFATEAELRSALQAQAESAAKGAPIPMGDILVQQGLLTPALREKAEEKLESQREEAKRLGPYRVLRKLGEGGMGAVYLAEDAGTGEKIALKVLPKVASKDQDAVRRFLREVESARKLEHPNIVRAGASGEDKGFHYVMEYVAGETLGARIKREEALPSDEAAKMVLQVAYGLKYAHEQGYIHRDIKPDNVIVNPEGVAKILDLGLSKNIDEAQTFRTVTGVTLGTPHYMAPEQARGDKGIDGRADIYSLGATYYHLVTGETPFHGTTAIELISQHLKKQLPDPRDIRGGIPDGVVHVIRRMMAKRPDDRYKDCGELIADLELVLGGRNPSSQALEAARSAVGLPMGREARERYRAQRRRERPGTVRATAKPRTTRVPRLVGGICMAAALVLLLALAFSGGSKPLDSAGQAGLAQGKPPEPPKVDVPEPPPPAPKTAAELREEEAQGKLDQIKVVEKRFAADEIRRRYGEFAREYADTAPGRTIAERLKSTEPKVEPPMVAEVPKTEEPKPEPVVKPPVPVPPPRPAVSEDPAAKPPGRVEPTPPARQETRKPVPDAGKLKEAEAALRKAFRIDQARSPAENDPIRALAVATLSTEDKENLTAAQFQARATCAEEVLLKDRAPRVRAAAVAALAWLLPGGAKVGKPGEVRQNVQALLAQDLLNRDEAKMVLEYLGETR